MRALQKDPSPGVISSPLESNMFFWNAVIFGPEDTPWESGTFRLTLEFTEEYPTKPPTVKFVTKIFHPNGNHANLKFISFNRNLSLFF